MNDSSWRIYTEDIVGLPQYIGANANINRAYVTQGCVVDGELTNSVLFTGAKVGTGAKIIDSVLMPGVVVEDGAVVNVEALKAAGIISNPKDGVKILGGGELTKKLTVTGCKIGRAHV